MDWKGQKLSEQLMQYTVLLSAIIACLIGFLLSSYEMMMLIYAGGVVLTFVISVPDWGYFNQNKLDWLPPRPPGSVSDFKSIIKSRAAKKDKPVRTKRWSKKPDRSASAQRLCIVFSSHSRQLLSQLAGWCEISVEASDRCHDSPKKSIVWSFRLFLTVITQEYVRGGSQLLRPSPRPFEEV